MLDVIEVVFTSQEMDTMCTMESSEAVISSTKSVSCPAIKLKAFLLLCIVHTAAVYNTWIGSHRDKTIVS